MASDRNTSVRSESSFITYVNDMKKLHARLSHSDWETQVFYDAESQRKITECRAMMKNNDKSTVKGLSLLGEFLINQVTRRKRAAFVEMPVIVPAGKRRSIGASSAGTNASSTRAPAHASDTNTRVSNRMTKGQKKDWRESSVSYDDTGGESGNGGVTEPEQVTTWYSYILGGGGRDDPDETIT
jgi:hypothetical protein